MHDNQIGLPAETTSHQPACSRPKPFRVRAAWLTAEITARPAGARGGALPDVAGGAVQLVAGTVALVQDELALASQTSTRAAEDRCRGFG